MQSKHIGLFELIHALKGCDFFFVYIYIYIINNKSKTPQTSFLILEANKNNSKVVPKSSSIELIGAHGFVISSLSFKHIIMVDYNAYKKTSGY